jgi:hypothetical protein
VPDELLDVIEFPPEANPSATVIHRIRPGATETIAAEPIGRGFEVVALRGFGYLLCPKCQGASGEGA